MFANLCYCLVVRKSMIFHDFSKKIDDCDEEGEGSDMAQASRASRAGTRAGRIVREMGGECRGEFMIFR